MNKKIICLSALALSFSLSQAPLTYAGHSKCFAGEHVAKMTEKLDLTTDQKAKIKAIREKAKADLMPLHKDMIANRQAVNALFKSGTVDDSKLETLFNQEKETLGSILKVRMMERRDISNLLTDKQKEKLAGMMQKVEKKTHTDNND